MMKDQPASGFYRFLSRFFFLLFILAVSAASVLLPAFLFVPVSKAPEKEIADRRFTVMLNQTPTIQNDPYDLAYWLIYCDPRSFALPDWNNGFSSFLRGGSRFSANHKDFEEDLSLTSPFSSPENQYVWKIRTPDQLLSRLRPAIPRSLPEVPSQKKTEKPSYPRWSDFSGKDLGDLFAGDQKYRSVLLRANPEKKTILQIDRNADNMPPSVRVYESCGSKALDILASNAFSAAAARNMRSSRFNGIRYAVIEWEAPEKRKK